MRLAATAAAPAAPPATVRPPLSAAQRCADDTLTLVFAFVGLKELARAARTCRAWLATTAKDQPRGLTRAFDQVNQLAAVCVSSSPFRRHIACITVGEWCSLNFNQLAQLRQLPELTALSARLSAMDLKRLMDEAGGGALAQLKAAFPPRLRRLTLVLPKVHSAATWQLQLDALPAMEGLQELSLIAGVDAVPGHSTALSLEPLLQLPRLTHLEWSVGNLTMPQMIIKQIATLQSFIPGCFSWSSVQLTALCRPPHRLQRLQEFNPCLPSIDAAMMADLVSLPELTAIGSSFAREAYSFLPRFPRLRSLSVTLKSWLDAAQQAQHSSLLVSALPACSALTDLTLEYRECSEFFGDLLMRAVPRLRSLAFEDCSLPSLRFLRHAPNLRELSLLECRDLRVGHVIGIGAFAAQLECLTVRCCAGLQLDEAEQQLLTPPGALGLPRLREFKYRPSPQEAGSDAGPDVLGPD